VLGGLKELPGLITRHRISRIVITAELKAESLAGVHKLARERGIGLSIWQYELRELEAASQKAEFAPIVPALAPVAAEENLGSAI